MTLYDLKNGSTTEPTGLPLSVALGNFDGLHIGHRRLIERAKCSEFKSCVFTFEENPFSKRIFTLENKLAILSELGVDYAAVYSFDTVRNIQWQCFASETLIDELNCMNAVCGFNFKFGKGAAGDSEMLKSFMESRGRSCIIEQPCLAEGRTVSSTRIREELEAGELEEAARLLCRPYSIEYSVSHGNGIGNTLGFPTINHAYNERDIRLPRGVYVCRALGRPAVTNFGVRPTVTDDDREYYETFILDYDGDLYGKNVRVEFFSFIRPEMKFSSTKELVSRIEKDVEITRDYLK